MLTLSVIALASGLALAPAPSGTVSTVSSVRCQRARATLDRMTSEAQVRLRDRAVADALNSGLRTFRMAVVTRQDVEKSASVADASLPQRHQWITIK